MCFMNLKKGYDYVQSGWGVLGWLFLVYELFVALQLLFSSLHHVLLEVSLQYFYNFLSDVKLPVTPICFVFLFVFYILFYIFIFTFSFFLYVCNRAALMKAMLLHAIHKLLHHQIDPV